MKFYKEPVVSHDDEGNVSIQELIENGNIIDFNTLRPFVVNDGNGNVYLSSIEKNGEVIMPNTSVLSTMTFYVNVIDSVFNTNVENMIF